jgi:hypothetical protein
VTRSSALKPLLVAGLLGAALVVLLVVVLPADGQDDGGGPVGAFPGPGLKSASPRTTLSLRGVESGALGDITVTGSRSGEHAYRVRAHPDGQGASLIFAQPFRGSETVRVQTGLNVAGATDGDFEFATLPRPRAGLGAGSPPPRSLLRQLLGQRGSVPSGAVPRFRTRRDLRPPEIEVTTRPRAGMSSGYTFVAPKKVFGARERPGLQSGPLIVDRTGEQVWFAPLSDGNVNDFRVQRYDGRPVLTWWQGRQVLGTGEGVVQILDERYRPVKRVRAGNGYSFDFHEATITDRGTLLALVYSPVNWDLRSVGGPRSARVIDSIVQEVDIDTGLVLFEWHSLEDVALTESYTGKPNPRNPYDYFHVNSVREDTDGNLIVSGRETHAAYKINRRTGDVMWRLGGKRSDFQMPRAARFAWQHDAQRDPNGTIRIFDNEAAPKVRDRSRVLWLRLDEQARTARIARAVAHPLDLLSGTQGNAQALPNGSTFVGWGSQGYFSEFSRSGRLLFDARVARGNDTYRAYRGEWNGRPVRPPDVQARVLDSRRTELWVSWNGATGVERWRVLAGSRRDRLTVAGAVRKDGFETRIVIRNRRPYVAVRAIGRSGRVLGRSVAVRVRER